RMASSISAGADIPRRAASAAASTMPASVWRPRAGAPSRQNCTSFIQLAPFRCDGWEKAKAPAGTGAFGFYGLRLVGNFLFPGHGQRELVQLLVVHEVGALGHGLGGVLHLGEGD